MVEESHDSKAPVGQKQCKCNSTSNLRTNHSECPLNPKRKRNTSAVSGHTMSCDWEETSPTRVTSPSQDEDSSESDRDETSLKPVPCREIVPHIRDVVCGDGHCFGLCPKSWRAQKITISSYARPSLHSWFDLRMRKYWPATIMWNPWHAMYHKNRLIKWLGHWSRNPCHGNNSSVWDLHSFVNLAQLVTGVDSPLPLAAPRVLSKGRCLGGLWWIQPWSKALH